MDVELISQFFGRGEAIVLGANLATARVAAEARDWGPERVIRGEDLAQVILGARPHDATGPPRLVVRGARISGQLDLGCGRLQPFLFEHCFFDEPPMLNDSSGSFAGFHACVMPGFRAQRFECSGPLWLSESRVSGSVDLEDSQLADLSAPRLRVFAETTGRALDCTGLRVGADAFLSGSEVTGLTSFIGAQVGGSVSLNGARLRVESLFALNASRLQIGGDLQCAGAKFEGGGINLEGCRLGGGLRLMESAVTGSQRFALQLDHAEIKLGLTASGSSFDGPVHMHHARIGCQVEFVSATISTRQGDALRADHIWVDGSFIVTGGTKVSGAVVMHGAVVECTLNLFGIEIVPVGPPSNNPALDLDGADVKGTLMLSGARISGYGFMRGLKVAHNFRMDDSSWGVSSSKPAIILDNGQFGRGLDAGKGFSCTGLLSARDASFEATVDLRDSKLDASGSKAIDFGMGHFAGDLVLDRAQIEGTVDLAKANFAGDLRFVDAKLNGSLAQVSSRGEPVDRTTNRPWRGRALRLVGSRIEGGVDLQDAEVSGGLDFDDTRILGALNLDGVRVSLRTGAGDGISARNMACEILRLRLDAPRGISILLQSARVSHLYDSQESYTDASEIDLSDFVYGELHGTSDLGARLNWLANATAGKFHPQPYHQLAAYYDKNGDVDAARAVRFETLRRSHKNAGAGRRIWGALQGVLIGYGYRPIRALAWAVVTFAFGWVFLSLPLARCETGAACVAPSAGWRPWLVALDLLLPFVRLASDVNRSLSSAGLVAALVLQAAGWVLLTVVAASVARHLRRN